MGRTSQTYFSVDPVMCFVRLCISLKDDMSVYQVLIDHMLQSRVSEQSDQHFLL